ncbi:MAG TPA: MarR family transcriptional regulator [Anaerolineales bacterium]
MPSTERLPNVLIEWTGVLMRSSSSDFNRIMRDYNLSMPQIGTLMRLYHHRAGAVSDIGTALGFTNAAASQMVDRLVQLGLIDRREDPSDRRVKHVDLTEKGRQLIHQIMEIRCRWIEDLTNRLTPEQRESVATALTLLTEAARQHEQPEIQNTH